MNKEKFMKFVSKACDTGANIEISFYKSSTRTEEQAIELVEEFASIVDEQVEEVHSVDFNSRWYRVKGDHAITVWHKSSNNKKGLKEHLEKLLGETEEQA